VNIENKDFSKIMVCTDIGRSTGRGLRQREHFANNNCLLKINYLLL